MHHNFATWPAEGTVDLFEKVAELIIMTASRTLMGEDTTLQTAAEDTTLQTAAALLIESLTACSQSCLLQHICCAVKHNHHILLLPVLFAQLRA